MDNALVCGCGGDRTLRHNAARDALYADACEAGIRAEKEKTGLLPPRPDEDSLREERLSAGRRPADVWLASWDGSGPAAIDLAITSGMRADRLSAAADDPTTIWGSYEDFKRGHMNTAAECHQQNLAFMPFVIEAHGGGFGPVARRVCSHVARAAAAREGETVEVQAASLMRRISTTVIRENARSVLRRLPRPAAAAACSSPAAWGEDAQAMWQ